MRHFAQIENFVLLHIAFINASVENNYRITLNSRQLL